MGSYKAKHRLRKKPTSYLTYKWNGSLEKCKKSFKLHGRVLFSKEILGSNGFDVR